MKNKFIKLSILSLMILGIGSGIHYYNSNATLTSEEEVQISESVVKKEDIKIGFIVDGAAELTAYELSFLQQGTIDEVLVGVGDVVKKGEIIATIDDIDYRRDIESANNNLVEAKVKMEKNKSQKEIAQISSKNKLDTLKTDYVSVNEEYQKMLKLSDIYTVEELDKKKNAVEKAKALYETEFKLYELSQNNINSFDSELDKLNVSKAELALEIAQEKLENTMLKSPIDGEILALNNEVGELVSDSKVFTIVANKKDLSVVAQVSELDLEQIEIGQRVDIQFEAIFNEVFSGTVLSIDPLATKDSSGIISYNVYITLNEGQERIKDGMTAMATFILAERLDVITIPNKAVQIVDKKQIVEVVTKEGNVEVRKIKTGLTDGSKVEVVEGLEVGEKVIIRK